MKLLEFIVASSLLTLMPGPDILFVMAQSIVQGRKTGIAVALGLCSGLFVHTALAALGISLIIASSPILFAAIRYAGIAYLIYMGIVSLRSRNDASVSIADSTATLQNESAGTFGKLYRTGITMNLLNPKIILFLPRVFSAIPRQNIRDAAHRHPDPRHDVRSSSDYDLHDRSPGRRLGLRTVRRTADPAGHAGLDPGRSLLDDRHAVPVLLTSAAIAVHAAPE